MPIATDTRTPGPVPILGADGIVRWDSPRTQASPSHCMPNAPAQVVLDAPQVLLWRCSIAPARRLVGVASDGTRWVRPLEHVSGHHRIDIHVGSARADAVTLNTLEVVDPATGGTIVAAPLRTVDTPARTIPLVGINGPVTCPSGDDPCYGYSPEGAQAGLLRIGRDGRFTVLEKPQTAWFAPIVANDLQLSPDRRMLFIAEAWLFRGTKWVRFAIFDLERGKRAFEHRLGEGRVVSDPRLILGPGARVAILYRDDTGGRLVAVSYRVHL